MAVVVDRIAGGGGVSIPVSLTTSMGATTTDGILLGATNSATAGAQVFSPALHFQGSGWKTTATAAAQIQNWFVEVVPIEDTTRPVNQLLFSGSSTAEGTAVPYLSIRRPNSTEGQLAVLANGGNSLVRGATDYANLGIGIYQWDVSPSGLRVLSAGVVTWSSSSSSIASPDTGLSRISAGVVGVGTGAAGSFAGTVKATQLLEESANGAQWIQGQASELLTIAAAASTDSSANLLPAGAIIESVVVRVTTVIPTAATFTVGDPTTAARFATGVAVAANTTAIGIDHWSGAIATLAAGPSQAAAAKVRITPNLTPGAATGVVRITVFYRQFLAPQS